MESRGGSFEAGGRFEREGGLYTISLNAVEENDV